MSPDTTARNTGHAKTSASRAPQPMPNPDPVPDPDGDFAAGRFARHYTSEDLITSLEELV
ncbi:hypothetical protein [Candidatus Poriferisodalis sp.]|uniref:hypothetical protein n=1 Tax=Candidatus Poriferisodalis sp. TaxID=3101277 RepID=UPI003B5A8A3B